MSREIKFRGISEGKWYYGLLTFMFGSYAIVDPKDENTVHLVDVKTVGQYTGLKDENGVEIYEGDIIFDGSNNYYVELKHGMFKPICYASLDNECKAWGYKVIGNIYENPELLEASK